MAFCHPEQNSAYGSPQSMIGGGTEQVPPPSFIGPAQQTEKAA
jgi:hypothetical protein